MTTSDPTPGDHDKLIAQLESNADAHHESEGTERRRAAAALRTEQSARQAAEAEHADVSRRLVWNMKRADKALAARDALQTRIDAALAINEDVKQDKHRRIRAALTESKEPDPKLVAPMPQIARVPVITLCGSTKFKDAINAENSRLTMEGNLVISLGLFGHTDLPDYNWDTDASDLKRTLDAIHAQKIDMADSVYVVNPGGYYGESTAREIAYARAHGKPVAFMEPEPADYESKEPDHE